MNMVKVFSCSLLLLLVFSLSTSECKDFNVHNYNLIMNDSKNGLYLNPFHDDRCFILSFDKNENIDEFLYENNDSLNKYILLYHNTDGVFVTHIKNAVSSKYFNSFNFRLNSRAGRLLKTMIGFYPELRDYFPELFFLHEIYHLKEVDFDGDYRYDEVEADLFAALVIINRYNLSMNDAQNLIYNLYQLRVNGLDSKFKDDGEILENYVIRANQVILMLDKVQIDDDFLDIHHLFEKSKRIEFN